MEKIRLEIIGLSSSQSQIGHYALVLGERGGKRRLPIIIGGGEAQAIALELEGIKANRPMTHDLIFNLASHFGMDLIEVIINDLREGIYYARLIFDFNGEIHDLDSRSSDAVAIAVRFSAPIYTYESVMTEGGIIMEDEGAAKDFADEEGDFSLEKVESTEQPGAASPAPTLNREAELKRLEKRLEDVLANENYEAAAQIRDQIDKLKANDE